MVKREYLIYYQNSVNGISGTVTYFESLVKTILLPPISWANFIFGASTTVPRSIIRHRQFQLTSGSILSSENRDDNDLVVKLAEKEKNIERYLLY